MAISKILDFSAGSKFAIRLPQDIRYDRESQNCDWVLFSVTPLLNLADSLAGTGTGYLKETWDQASSLHSIHFRQVNFPDASTVYFHCELKVCKNSEETTCSTTELGMFCIRFLQDYHFQLHKSYKFFAKLFKNLVMQWLVEVITTVGQIHDENANLNLIKLFLSPPKL